jgi:competence protein ComEC
MLHYSLAFLLGSLLLQWQTELLPPRVFYLLPLAAIAGWRVRALRIPLFILGGFLWAATDAHDTLGQRLPEPYYQQDLAVGGRIVAKPQPGESGVRFHFLIDRVSRHAGFPTPMLVRLNWYDRTVSLSPGQYWKLRVRLKPPRGFMNPAAFDYEGWLFRSGITATGYVRDDPANRQVAEQSHTTLLHLLRERIGSHIDSQLGGQRAGAILRALTIGDRSDFAATDWALFRASGTSHLIAISGLHIGIAGGLLFWLSGTLWRRFPWLCLRIPAQQAAACGAITGATCYAALAGFPIPTQRALLMLLIVMGGLLLRTGIRPLHGFAMALMVVLALDPAAPLAAGFWLSFAAVGVILAALVGRTGRSSKIGALVRIQWMISLGLAPLLLLWPQQVPAVAPLVNLVAVPLFSLLIIPLSLFAVTISQLSAEIGALLIQTSGWLIEWSLRLMEVVVSVPWRLPAPASPTPYHWLSLGSGVLLLLLPRGLPGRWLGVLLLLPFLLVPGDAKTVPDGALFITMFDVGQGMAITVRTANHTLVYDGGPKYSPDFDAGSGIVAPYLEQLGIERIDLVIVSNGDADHSGGVAGLLERIPAGRIISGEPGRLQPYAPGLCRDGDRWHWDGVEFSLLHPGAGRWNGNDASCVLLIRSEAGTFLITGDIESAAERRLLACCREELSADIVTVPHHGSSTSSTSAFVAAVNADYALISNGYLNRYGFPRPSVSGRWLSSGAQLVDTAGSGAIQFRILPEAGIVGPIRYREQGRHYWTYPPP